MRNTGRLTGIAAMVLAVAACAGTGGDVTTTTDGDPAATTTRAEPATTTTEAMTTTTEAETTSTAGTSGGASITIVNFNFSGPATVPVGTAVIATNEDNFAHTWTSDDDVWDSGTLSGGDSFEFTFEEPGEYSYFCRIHPTQMTGTITVTG